jgi:peptide chain release factor subunit 1
MVDATPWIGPMLAVLDQYRRGCAAVVDRESAHVWELYLGEVRDRGHLERRALRSATHACRHGRAESRGRNKADELSRRHFRELAEALELLFRADRYDVLAVGGHEHQLPGFLDLLPPPLRERVAERSRSIRIRLRPQRSVAMRRRSSTATNSTSSSGRSPS